MKPKVNEMKARKIPVIYKDEKGVIIVKEAVAFYDEKNGDIVDPTKNDEYTEEEIKKMTDDAFEYGESLD
ncbi:hypothetical protein C2U55_15540 [Enterobacteriaceae bacterium ENNIH3]|nr:hypothetical protein C2U55_15540 [Enterobacteriaceae bacterium ENNIH3]AUV09524.1 hypothetical protein C2U52_26355 [Enterobacteriaceae bacterium ENNIH2]PWF51155.1 hypothetical protein BHT19_0009435 [[Kluyvera] intestini]